MNRYQEAGVDVNAGYELVKRIKENVKSTNRPGALGGIGAFGGLFDLGELKVKHPVLVSGTDGVGTKLLITKAMDQHDTIGIDVVAMCVNDVLAQGAEPLYFLDITSPSAIIRSYYSSPSKIPAKASHRKCFRKYSKRSSRRGRTTIPVPTGPVSG